MNRLLKSLFTAAAVLTVSASSAHATSITTIDFQTGNGGTGGTLNIGSDITGSGIFIDSVTISGAPVNNGVFDVNGAGVCATGGSGTCGLLSFDQNLNTISLVGSIPSLGILAPVPLLTGNLSGGVTVAINNGAVGGIYASGTDTKNPALLSAVGLDPATPFQVFGFSTGVNSNGLGSPYTVISTDITNTSVGSGAGSGQTLTPEPGSLVLFGTGLFGLAGRFRRRFMKV